MGHKIGMGLVLVGALNWGLVGLFKFNLVMAILGSVPVLERIVYVLVGLAAVMVLVGCRCKMCKGSCGTGAADMEGKSCCGGGMNEEKKM